MIHADGIRKLASHTGDHARLTCGRYEVDVGSGGAGAGKETPAHRRHQSTLHLPCAWHQALAPHRRASPRDVRRRPNLRASALRAFFPAARGQPRAAGHDPSCAKARSRAREATEGVAHSRGPGRCDVACISDDCLKHAPTGQWLAGGSLIGGVATGQRLTQLVATRRASTRTLASSHALRLPMRLAFEPLLSSWPQQGPNAVRP